MGSRERETILDSSPAALSLACFLLCTTGIAKPSAFSTGPRPKACVSEDLLGGGGGYLQTEQVKRGHKDVRSSG